MRTKNAANTMDDRRPAKRRRRDSFEIQIPLRRRFVPGTAPPTYPLSLLPPHDSDAFIVDKLVTPLGALQPGARRILSYLISWPDFSSARVTVPANRILDYVSPRELEDWEYRNSEKLEEEEFEEQTKLAILESLGQMPEDTTMKEKKRRGRPPGARAQPEEPPPEPDELAETAVPSRAAGPSLSTPKKRPWRDLAPGVDESETDEFALYQQLKGDEQLDDSETDELQVQVQQPRKVAIA